MQPIAAVLLQAAFLVMNHIGGKLLMFQHGVPSIGVGKLKARENLALYGTDRESTLRNPEDQFFKRFAAEACRVQMTLDLFIGSGSYTDLASLLAIPRYTCGQVRAAGVKYGCSHSTKALLRPNDTEFTNYAAVRG
jgi:protein transport protein SEC24